MKSLKLICLLGIFVVISAQNGIKETQMKQSKRIAQGVRSGELTKQEAKKLKNGQKKIQKMKKRAKFDGVVTKKEKTRIKKEQKKQSNKIYKQKHDKQKNLKRKFKKNN